MDAPHNIFGKKDSCPDLRSSVDFDGLGTSSVSVDVPLNNFSSLLELGDALSVDVSTPFVFTRSSHDRIPLEIFSHENETIP